MSKLKPNTDKKQQNENIVPNRLQTIERSTENKSVTRFKFRFNVHFDSYRQIE